MTILGIETSCDETSLCLLQIDEHGNNKLKYKVLAHSTNSQIEIHKEYGGVYPALAKREHIKNLPILFEKIINDTKFKIENIDLIAVTEGPGLEPALWTGIVFAKELSAKYNIPIIPINHMEGHIVSSLLKNSNTNDDFIELKEIKFPSLSLLISGGHTELIKIIELGKYKILGETRDDAIGEAFDKVARMLNLSYPGGPKISELANFAREKNLPKTFSLPRPMINSKDLDFSFAGLKTSILYLLKDKNDISEEFKQELCREFEDSVTEVLIEKTKKALDTESYNSLIIGGGVIANENIRNAFINIANEYNIELYIPVSGLTGDNALMIALAGSLRYKQYKDREIKAKGNMRLDE